MIERARVEKIVEDYLAGSENYPVGVDIHPGNKIIVEIDSDKGVSIDDCIALTKHIESKLDRDVEDYELEVGSAGLSQPFKILRQYIKNIGNEIEVLTKNGKKQSGILKNADNDKIILAVEKQIKPEGSKRKVTIEEELTFVYDEIKQAKYIIRFK
jgi:ribosome maturation factor RimP